ncbi:MAG: efflux RND transporter periplasmic adaptor subunit [Candidatus Hydrogenedentes bacterium]|nr:efflux RND transporter periplasmic adaptor subunit [Candidatus Hydrogenedentota bacterium]
MRTCERLAFVSLAVFGVLGAGCSAPVEGKAPDAPEAAAQTERILVPVEVQKPARKDISSYFETTTRVQAERRVEVLAKGAGICDRVFFEEGDRVAAEAVLAELDKTELAAQVRQAQVTLRQQKTTFEIAEKSLAEGIGAPVERDNARFAYEQAQAALEMNEARLAHQTVRAPIGGIITRRSLQEGMLVSPGMPAFTIMDPDSYALPISVPEKELAKLAVGQEALVRVDSLEGEELRASIRRINPSMDPLSGTVKVVLEFGEADRARLRDSAFARVRLVMQTIKDALVVPKDAIVEENARSFLMVAEPPAAEAGAESAHVARRVEVEKGLEDSEVVQILSGVSDESLVVVMGQHALKPDAEISVTTAAREIESRKDMEVGDALEAARKRAEEEKARKESQN